MTDILVPKIQIKLFWNFFYCFRGKVCFLTPSQNVIAGAYHFIFPCIFLMCVSVFFPSLSFENSFRDDYQDFLRFRLPFLQCDYFVRVFSNYKLLCSRLTNFPVMVFEEKLHCFNHFFHVSGFQFLFLRNLIKTLSNKINRLLHVTDHILQVYLRL